MQDQSGAICCIVSSIISSQTKDPLEVDHYKRGDVQLSVPWRHGNPACQNVNHGSQRLALTVLVTFAWHACLLQTLHVLPFSRTTRGAIMPSYRRSAVDDYPVGVTIDYREYCDPAKPHRRLLSLDRSR